MAVIISDQSHQDDDDLYVFVVAGQSNAAYYNYNVNIANEELPHIDSNMAFFYGTASKPVYWGNHSYDPTYDDTFTSYGWHDMVGSNGKYVIGNIDAAFASYFVKETGNRIYVINTAIPGQAISNMISGEEGNDYAQEVFTHAMAVVPDGYNIKMGSILFIQGESDSETPISTYESQFVDMFDSFKDFTHAKTLILSQTRPSDGVNSSQAQIQICETVPGVYLGSTAASTFINGTPMMAGDGIHYSQKGDDIIGHDLVNCYVKNLLPYKAPFEFMMIIPAIVIISIVFFAMRVVISQRD